MIWVRGVDGQPLPCCWDECEHPGDDREKVVVHDGQKSVNYIFCSERHKFYWLHSTISYGNLPAGFRTGLIPR